MKRPPAFYFTEVLIMFVYLFTILSLAAPPLQLLPSADLAAIRKAMPQVDEPITQKVLLDPATLWYDERVMPQAYQDPIPPITGLRNPGTPVAPEEIFTGGRFRFPWGHTAGAHRCGSLTTVKFLHLPTIDEVTLPVAYWREGLEYRWIFPRGTMVGEVLMVHNPNDGRDYVFEIRTRTKEWDSWTVNAFRPFPRSDHLYAALKARKSLPTSALAVMAHLVDPPALQPAALADGFGAMRAVAYVDVLPPIDDDLAVDLLTSTPFRSCHGEPWMADADGRPMSHAPTTNDPFSIVPARYDAGVIAVNDQSCNQCHRNCSEAIALFDSDRVLYGRIWGSDQVFSWHPFEPMHVHADEDYVAGDGNLRHAFLEAGIVERFNEQRHLPAFYRTLPRRE